jgi:hypothetical protein
MFRNGTLALVIGLSSVMPAFAGWQNDISAADSIRLSKIAMARSQGLAEAQSAAPADAAAIRSVMEARSIPVSNARIEGAWHCRQMKLGGVTPAVVYSWFSCRISRQGADLKFEKLNGSTQTAGTLYSEGGSYVYLGAVTMAGESKHAYSGNRAAAGAAATPDDQVGVLSLLADGRARLELPYPVQESVFDIIELKR